MATRTAEAKLRRYGGRRAGRLTCVALELWGGDDQRDFGPDRLLRPLRQELLAWCETGIGRLWQSMGLAVGQRRAAERHAAVLLERQRLWLPGGGAGRDFYFVPASRHRPDYALRLPSGRRVVLAIENVADASPAAGMPPAPQARRLALREVSPARDDGRGELTIALEWIEMPRRRARRAMYRPILDQLAQQPACAAWYDELSAPHAAAKKLSLLEHHLAALASMDEQAHTVPKQPGARLRAELQSYLSATVAPLDVLLAADNAARAKLLWMANAVRSALEPIIALWERRTELMTGVLLETPKVMESHWCVTLDRVPRVLWPQIEANAGQRAAWREQVSLSDDARLEEHPYLMVDTAHFDAAFREQLMALADLDEPCDGLLIESENLRALGWLESGGQADVRCIFIDPPYNTGSDAWVYADRFAHAAWESLLRDRLAVARRLLRQDGAVLVSLDDHEQARLRLLLDDVLGEENFLATIVWEKVHTRKNSARHFSVSHDYIPAFARDKQRWARSLLPREQTGAYANPDGDPRGPWKPDPVYANKPYGANYQIIKPTGEVLARPPGQYWRMSEANFLARAARGEVIWGDGSGYPLVKRYLADVQDGLVPVTLFSRQFAGDNAVAQAQLRALFGQGRGVSYPKPSLLVRRIVQIATRRGSNETVLDFFAGSGTTGQAVIEQNRADGGGRRYVLIEMREYFHGVLKPRIIKTVYSRQWRDGHPLACDGGSHTLRYVRLESLEEAIEREIERRESAATCQ